MPQVPQHKIDYCKNCDAAIIWITDQNGTKLPMNKTRVRVYQSGTIDSTGELKWFFCEDKDEPVLFYISHFVTCPCVRADYRRGSHALQEHAPDEDAG